MAWNIFDLSHTDGDLEMCESPSAKAGVHKRLIIPADLKIDSPKARLVGWKEYCHARP
jgi:hypothetical protein